VPKINVYLPDGLAEAVKQTDVPVSAVCQHALQRAVRRVLAVRAVAAGLPVEQAFTASADNPISAGTPGFTRRVVSAMELARRHSSEAGLPAFGTGHLLAALLADDTLAGRVLAAMEIEPALVTAALARAGAGPADGGPAHEGVSFNSQVASVLERATNESTALGNNYVGSEHLLLGMIGEPDGAAGVVLRELGADLRGTRRAVAAALTGWAAGRAASQLTAEPSQPALSAAIEAALAPVLSRLDELESRLPAAG
jgi:ATP-dependent Clp protease ATP-binding subunit ClpA